MAKTTEPIDEPWDLPEGWKWKRLGDLCGYVSRGRSPTYVGSGGVFVINQRCVRWGGIDFTHCKQTSRQAFIKLDDAQHLRAGDIIWNSTGTGTIGRAAIFPDIDGTYVPDSHVTVLRPKDVFSKWIEAWISTYFVQQRVVGIGSTNQVELSRDTVVNMPIPFVNRSQQVEIITKLNKLIVEIEEGEGALTLASAGLDTYCKSLVNAAVTGQLTDDWRKQNPAQNSNSTSINQIGPHHSRALAKANDAGRRTGSSALPKLPRDWAWVNLNQLADGSTRNGLSIKESSEPTEVKALRLNALARDSVDWTKYRYLPRTRAQVSNYELQDGDILVSRANGSPSLVGRAAICANPPIGMIFPDTAIRYRLMGDAILKQWVIMCWNSDFVRQQILLSAKTTAGILKISQDDIAKVALPLPGVEEISVALKRLRESWFDSAIDNEFGSLRGLATSLRQSIFSAAFHGELLQ